MPPLDRASTPLRVVVAALVAAGAALLGTTGGAGATEASRPAITVVHLTTAGQHLAIRRTSTADRALAPVTNTDEELRVLWWNRSARPTSGGEACETFTAANLHGDPNRSQEGVALHVRRTSTRLTALTVTKNIFTDEAHQWAYGVFNVHGWTLTGPSTHPHAVFTLLAQFNLRGVFAPGGILVPPPWSMCARIVGATLQFRAWLTGTSVPGWGDPTHGGATSIPTPWRGPGVAGWYAGHLVAGASVTYTAQYAGRNR